MLDNTALFNSINELKIIDKELLDESLEEAKESGETLEKILHDRDLIADENLGVLVADILGSPFVRLDMTMLDRATLLTIPEEMARSRSVLVFHIDDTTVNVAMRDPQDIATIDFIAKYLGKKVKVFYATERDFKLALFGYRREPSEVFAEVFEGIIEKGTVKSKINSATESPIIKIVETMMTYAYQSRASDIHIEPFDKFVQIRFRVDGVLEDIIKVPKLLHDEIVSRIKIVTNLPTDEHQSALDGKFVFKIHDIEDVDVRVSIVPSTNGERIVMRLLASNLRQFALLDLGFSEKAIEVVRKAYTKPYGMILATGPTGSGKTTTMYAFIKILNKRNVNIMTIEDPVEYQVKGVNQIQVNPKTNLTFADGLKSIVRQDPNIVLVGEIRDEETANIAVNAALTGHLVLSTLHTNDAATTFPRLLEMGVEPFLVSSSVSMIVAQRLVRKICPSCRVSKIESLSELEKELPITLIKKHLDKEVKGIRTYYGKGCEVCHQSGYQGRVGIFEVMEMTDALREAIVSKKDAEEIKKIAINGGMQTMIENGLEKVKLGLTTIEELIRVTKS